MNSVRKNSFNLPILSDSPTPKPGPTNLQQRLLYGALGAALLLGSVWYGPVTFGLFFASVQAVMLWEFYKMMRIDEHYIFPSIIGVFISLLIFMTNSLLFGNKAYRIFLGDYFAINEGQWGQWLLVLLVPTILLLPIIILIREMIRWPQNIRPFHSLAITAGGIIYICMPMTMLNVLAFYKTFHAEYDYRRIFGLLFLIWASDIGAYMAGKTFGKHKLAPKISPGKTWEGWAGGVLLTLAVGGALKFLLPDVPLAHLLTAAAVVAVFGPLGDLAESMLKRSVGVKDSGRIMPGHGGLLDRFDAFLLVLPVLALLQLLL